MSPRVLRAIVAITTMMATFLVILDVTIANVALDHMRGSLSAGVDEITWVLTSFLVANAISLPITGWLTDLLGRKRLFIMATAAFTLTSAAVGAAPSLAIIVIARFLQGLAGGPLVPLSQSTMIETFPARQSGMAMAIWGIGIMFAISACAAVAIFFAAHAIASLYTRDQAVLAIATQLIAFVAFFQLFDTAQVVIVNALRGYKIALIPMLVYTVALWGIGLGGGYALGLERMDAAKAVGLSTPMGAAGFWLAGVVSVIRPVVALLGTVAMARAQDPDSADSQFYICLGPQSFLDGKYTVFGQVTDKASLEVIQKVTRGDVMKKVTVK